MKNEPNRETAERGVTRRLGASSRAGNKGD